jgi:orotidine-5'-phosphate decarboxylase
MKAPVFCALDTPDVDRALAIGHAVAPYVHGLKLGLEFFLANGPWGVERVQKLDLPIFLDLKLHDIPNTVAGAVRSVARLGIEYLTVHGSGGPAMLQAAQEAADGHVKLLGITVLTSLDDDDLKAVGQLVPVGEQVERLARLVQSSRLPGLVCSPMEVALLREKLGSDFILMVPGIRPTASSSSDQKRTLTPPEAVAAGVTYMVIGRPITGAADPAAAAQEIAESLKVVA